MVTLHNAYTALYQGGSGCYTGRNYTHDSNIMSNEVGIALYDKLRKQHSSKELIMRFFKMSKILRFKSELFDIETCIILFLKMIRPNDLDLLNIKCIEKLNRQDNLTLYQKVVLGGYCFHTLISHGECFVEESLIISKIEIN